MADTEVAAVYLDPADAVLSDDAIEALARLLVESAESDVKEFV